MNVQDLKAKIKTAANLKTTLNSLNRIKKKDAFNVISNKEGTFDLKYVLREIGVKLGVINRDRKREMKKLNPSTAKGTMGSIEQNSLRPKKLDFASINPKSWQKFKETVTHQAGFTYKEDKMVQYRENLYKAIDKQLPLVGDYFKGLLDKFSDQVLYESYYDSPFAQLGYVYSKDNENMVMENMIIEFEEYVGRLNAFSGGLRNNDKRR